MITLIGMKVANLDGLKAIKLATVIVLLCLQKVKAILTLGQTVRAEVHQHIALVQGHLVAILYTQ